MTPAKPLTTSHSPIDEAATATPLEQLTVGDLLRRAAAEHPSRDALVAGTAEPSERRRWTYEQLLADSERTARALAGAFRPGEHVAIWAPNVPEWLLLEFGAALAGLVVVTVNPALRPAEVAYVLERSGAVGLFLTPECRGNPMADIAAQLRPQLPALREVIGLDTWEAFLASGDPGGSLPAVQPGDPAQIQFTSGTTGFPKGVVLAHHSIVNNALLVVERARIESDAPVWVDPMPLFHTGGCVLGALGTLWLGATHIPLVFFDPGVMLELIEVERASTFSAVPTMLIALLDHPTRATRDLSSLRRVLVGGSLVPAPVVSRLEDELGVRFANVFGQTECSPVATMVAPDDALADKASTVGRPLPHTEAKIIDPGTGATVPCGVTGEFCTRGFHVMIGYHDDRDATDATIDVDGWLHTGDLCSMDERGYVTVEGRLKDMIVRGGENIYPREIENVLVTHPDVAEAAVVGIPDDYWGEIVGAFVRPVAGGQPSTDELSSWCRGQLAPYKVPVQWRLIDEWPLTGSGKIQKFVLRDWAAGDGPPEPTP